MTRSYQSTGLAASVALIALLSGCGDSPTSIEVSPTTTLTEASISDPAPAPGDKEQGLPGYPAVRTTECEEFAGESDYVAEIDDWVPINQMVNEGSTAVIKGTVTGVSEPRITALEETSRVTPLYFRLVTVEVRQTDRLTSRVGSPTVGTPIQLMLFGAGGLDISELCYGPDWIRDDRELPISVGDDLTALVEVWNVPIEGRSSELYYLTWGWNGLWLTNEAKSDHVVPEFQIPSAEIVDLLRREAERGLVNPSELDPDNPLETRPTESQPPSTPSTVPPPPPGIDAPDSETIPPPADD
jgi:hypothetical protein